ncbi:MAG: hypothetical protein DIU75_009670 [Mycolicibacterium hassiacum]
MSMPLRKPEGLSWSPATVELPEVPTIQPGEDALSATIAAVLPTLSAQLAVNVASLQAKEATFAGKLGAAEAAYQTSDDAGSQSVGQVVGMLGQLGQQAGQLGQMAGAPAQAAGAPASMFGSLMQQAMQAAQTGQGSPMGTQPPGAPPPGTQPPGTPPPGQQPPGTPPPGQQPGAAGGQPGGPAPVGAPGHQPPRDHDGAEPAVRDQERPETRPDGEQRDEARAAQREPLLRADDTHPAVPVPPSEQGPGGRDEEPGRRL